MLHVFFGTDTTKVRSEAFSFLETLEGKQTEVTRITPTDFQSGMLPEYAQGVGLFGTTHIVVLDTPSEDEGVIEEVFSHLDLLQSSENHFVLIDGPYDAVKKKKLNKYANEIRESVAEKGEKFNVFSITDALLRRDKKSLWLLLTTMRKQGIPHEEIIGILFWQLKILRLVSKTHSAEEAGQKPFVYQKTKRALQNFTANEIDNLSHSLVSIYHQGHAGENNLDYALEHWILSI